MEPADDGVVGETILEHFVDAQADGVGKAGNLAVSGPVFPAQEGEEIPATSSDFVFSRASATGGRFIHSSVTGQHRPLLMEEVSKLERGCERKGLQSRELGDFDSVKKVSMLVD
jgi:hypothetical protein